MSGLIPVRRRRWGIALRAAVTLSIFGYLIFKVDWSSIAAQLARADLNWLLLACACFGMTYALAALRWWFLLRVQEIMLSLRTVTALTFIGQFFNTFMLGSIGGDVVKAVYLQRYAPHRRTQAMFTIVLDRVLGLAVLLGISLLALSWQLQFRRMETVPSVVLGLILAFAAIIATGILVAVTPFHRAAPGLRRLWARIPRRHVIELLISGFRQHGAALDLTSMSVVVAVVLTLVLNFACYCIAKGIGLDVSYFQLLVIVTVAICVISLPISIGGHGVREGVFTLMFASFGAMEVGRSSMRDETAILFSLLFFAIPLAWSAVGAVVYMTFRHEYPSLEDIARGDAHSSTMTGESRRISS